MSMVREERTIEVTLISATDLKKVKKFGGEQKCYVAAYIYPARKQITPADLYGGVNPNWNTTLKLTCYETDLHPGATSGAPGASSSSSPSSHEMTVEIYSHGGGIFHSSDKLVGTVIVSLRDVASAAKVDGAMRPFEVHLPSGGVQGTLNLSVKLGAKRELKDYEDLTAAVLPSYSNDQEASSLSYTRAKDQVPGAQPRSYTPTGQSASDKDPPTKAYPTMNRGLANKNPLAAEDAAVTGYPAPGYAFAPLGQLPTQRQGGYGPETGNQGPYVQHSPESSGRLGPIGRRRARRQQGWSGMDGQGQGQRRRRGPIGLGIMVLQGIFAPLTTGTGHHRESNAQNQTGLPSSSSSQQTWQTPDSNYGGRPSSSSSQQTWQTPGSNYGGRPSSSSSQQTWQTPDSNYGGRPSSSSSQQTSQTQDSNYGQTKNHS